MKRLICILAAVALGACTPDIAGSPHGYSGTVSTTFTDVDAVPTILQPGEEALHSSYGPDVLADMPGTYEVDIAGNIRATGVPAYWLAMATFCARAPNAVACGGSAPPG